MNKLKIIKNNKGFTLLELLVGLLIIGVMSTLVIANFRASDQKNELEDVVNIIVDEIQGLEDDALGLKKLNASHVEGGWGIFMPEDGTYYSVFADIVPDGEYVAADGELISTYNFPANVAIDGRFSGVGPNGVAFNNKRELHIVFEPPDPTTVINTRGGGAGQFINNARSIDIVLEHTGTGESKTIIVNSAGLIEAQ